MATPSFSITFIFVLCAVSFLTDQNFAIRLKRANRAKAHHLVAAKLNLTISTSAKPSNVQCNRWVQGARARERSLVQMPTVISRGFRGKLRPAGYNAARNTANSKEYDCKCNREDEVVAARPREDYKDLGIASKPCILKPGESLSRYFKYEPGDSNVIGCRCLAYPKAMNQSTFDMISRTPSSVFVKNGKLPALSEEDVKFMDAIDDEEDMASAHLDERCTTNEHDETFFPPPPYNVHRVWMFKGVHIRDHSGVIGEPRLTYRGIIGCLDCNAILNGTGKNKSTHNIPIWSSDNLALGCFQDIDILERLDDAPFAGFKVRELREAVGGLLTVGNFHRAVTTAGGWLGSAVSGTTSVVFNVATGRWEPVKDAASELWGTVGQFVYNTAEALQPVKFIANPEDGDLSLLNGPAVCDRDFPNPIGHLTIGIKFRKNETVTNIVKQKLTARLGEAFRSAAAMLVSRLARSRLLVHKIGTSWEDVNAKLTAQGPGGVVKALEDAFIEIAHTRTDHHKNRILWEMNVCRISNKVAFFQCSLRENKYIGKGTLANWAVLFLWTLIMDIPGLGMVLDPAVLNGVVGALPGNLVRELKKQNIADVKVCVFAEALTPDNRDRLFRQLEGCNFATEALEMPPPSNGACDPIPLRGVTPSDPIPTGESTPRDSGSPRRLRSDASFHSVSS